MGSYEDKGAKRRGTAQDERTPKRHRIRSSPPSTIENIDESSEDIVCFGTVSRELKFPNPPSLMNYR